MQIGKQCENMHEKRRFFKMKNIYGQVMNFLRYLKKSDKITPSFITYIIE